MLLNLMPKNAADRTNPSSDTQEGNALRNHGWDGLIFREETEFQREREVDQLAPDSSLPYSKLATETGKQGPKDWQLRTYPLIVQSLPLTTSEPNEFTSTQDPVATGLFLSGTL